MSFVATWTVLTPEGTANGGEMTVHTPADVARLVTELAGPGATAAMIRHEQRPTISDPNLGEVPDHDMTAGVWQGYGYLSFTDAEHEYMVTVGDPRSPGYAAHYIEYDAGTGIALSDLEAALVRFLDTTTRPDNVEWQPTG